MTPAPETDAAYTLIVPIVLLVLMVAMGMELTRDDFRALWERPRAAFVGLFGQLVLLPLAALSFAHWPGFPPEIAIGIVVIAACPGGTMSNVFSYLARANLALSIALTSISSMVCFVTTPLWINFALDWFGSDTGTTVRLPFLRTVAQLFFVMLLPVLTGMLIRARWPEWTLRVQPPLRRVASALMGMAIAVIFGGEWRTILAHFESASVAAVVLVSAMLGLGWALARIAGVDERDAFTISIEVGLQNGALATMILVTLLGRPDLIVFPGTYVVLALLPVSLWTILMRRRLGA